MRLSDLHGKVVFWDIDGTLTEFRFGDRIWPCQNNTYALSQDIVNTGIFRNRKPIQSIRRLITASKAERHVILGKLCYSGEREQKDVWLDTYYPEMENRLWVGIKEKKGDVLRTFLAEFKIPFEKAVFIDDDIEELAYAERTYGVCCYHISSLFDWEEE